MTPAIIFICIFIILLWIFNFSMTSYGKTYNSFDRFISNEINEALEPEQRGCWRGKTHFWVMTHHNPFGHTMAAKCSKCGKVANRTNKLGQKDKFEIQ